MTNRSSRRKSKQQCKHTGHTGCPCPSAKQEKDAAAPVNPDYRFLFQPIHLEVGNYGDLVSLRCRFCFRRIPDNHIVLKSRKSGWKERVKANCPAQPDDHPDVLYCGDICRKRQLELAVDKRNQCLLIFFTEMLHCV